MYGNQHKVYNLYRRLLYKWQDDIDSDRLRILRFLRLNSFQVVYPGFDDDVPIMNKENIKRHKRRNRVFKWLSDMWQSYDQLYWITLTLADDTLQFKTFMRYVRKALNEQCFDYIANSDFGEKKQRLHFHAVCALSVPFAVFAWKYGFFTIKKINMGDKSKKRLSSYTVKLANHAGKLTSGRVFRKRGLKVVDELPF